MKYPFSSKAEREIASIWHYTFENWSLEQADRYFSQIMAEVEHLAKFPESGREFSHRGKKYRFSQVKSHLIFYREMSASKIEIIRILHKSMDIGNRVSE